jgi:hypothetical protein
VEIHCPYCDHAIALGAAKPGRYTTKCSQCDRKFLLGVPSDPAKAPVVAAMKSQLEETTAGPHHPPSEATAVEPAMSATVAHGLAATEAAGTATPHIPGPASTEAAATGAWTPSAPKSAEETDVLGLAPTEQAGETIAPPTRPAPSADVPASLGGYQILRELGRGGMGSVYLARQASLGRNVALKTMKPQWAKDPAFVARFTREAFAAAQLVHHNVIQIYDFGEDRGTAYFSMEFVDGQSLADLLRDRRKIDVEAAVGYVLQAARGLKYAHDQSMIHRDIKPDNLMLNQHGIVKVADLGLVKTPALAEELERREAGSATRAEDAAELSANLTRADIAMGTPAFMAPEQGRDAAGVDARADIYSLGCTLYDLVTGRPPFEGKTAMEVITKHQSEPVVPPDALVKRVPKALSDIILKMVAKRPEDRYQDLGAAIRDLEGFLGISSAGPFTPREEHVETVERAVVQFQNAPMARLRPKVILGFLAGSTLLVLICALLRRPLFAGAFLGLGLLTVMACFVTHGLRTGSPLFERARAFLLGSSLVDWLTWVAALVLIVTVLVVFKLIWVWVAVCVVAVGLAVAFDRAIDRRVDIERDGPLDEVEGMLKSLRLHGLDEEALRQFVARHAGDHWEAFYEALFGYDAKLTARALWGQGRQGTVRPRHAAWRDPLVAWLDAKQAARKAAREKRTLQKIEEKGLVAKGENLVTARRKAERAAEAMVTMAAEVRATAATAPGSAPLSAPLARALRDAARKPEAALVNRERGLIGRRTSLLDVVLGPRIRFLAGAALLAGCLLWMHQNGLLTREHLEAARQTVQNVEGLQDVQKAAREAVQKVARTEIPKQTEPLRVPLLPSAITARFNGFAPGVAGLVLLVSALFRGGRMGLFVVPGALMALLGKDFGLPSLGPLDASVAGMAVGVGLLVLGILFGRER